MTLSRPSREYVASRLRRRYASPFRGSVCNPLQLKVQTTRGCKPHGTARGHHVPRSASRSSRFTPLLIGQLAATLDAMERIKFSAPGRNRTPFHSHQTGSLATILTELSLPINDSGEAERGKTTRQGKWSFRGDESQMNPVSILAPCSIDRFQFHLWQIFRWLVTCSRIPCMLHGQRT